MRRLDRLDRWGALRGLVLWLCLALLGACAQAAPRAMQEANANSAAAMDARTMAAFADCMPCPGCYLAPAPQGFSGEGKEPEEPVWRVPAASPADADDRMVSGAGAHACPCALRSAAGWIDQLLQYRMADHITPLWRTS